MTHLEAFTRDAAKRYLHNIVFVDDEIYARLSGQPVAVTSDLPSFKSPFGGTRKQPAVAELEKAAAESEVPYHPRQLVESFAKEGMVCALYEPPENFENSTDSELFKLCERADVVIFDWDLFHEDGQNILPLIRNLVDQTQNSTPHHSRLCVIYTTKPDLSRVSSAIFDDLRKADLGVKDVQDLTTLVAGAMRIIVLGKPGAPGRSDEIKAFEVPEEKLADRVIDEFAKMHSGVLPSYALYGMASVRRNSKKILDKFHSDLDGAFLLHRALVLADEDAFEQLPELIAEEVLSILTDDQLDPDQAKLIAQDAATALQLDSDALPNLGGNALEKTALVKAYLGGGARAIDDKCKISWRKHPAKIHAAMGCSTTYSDKKLAALFNLRSNYFENKQPVLTFGTIIRWQEAVEDNSVYSYALCLMPVCDSIRLASEDGETTSFPFWTLMTAAKGGSSRGIVIPTREGQYVELYASGKPRDMLWIEKFAPASSGVIIAMQNDGVFCFSGANKQRLEWVAQLKPSHAQRVAHDIGHSFSRVGVIEAEWLRIVTEGKS